MRRPRLQLRGWVLRGGFRRLLRRAKRIVRRGRRSVVGLARRTASGQIWPAARTSSGFGPDELTRVPTLARAPDSDIMSTPQSPDASVVGGWVQNESDEENEENDWDAEGAEERAIIRDAGHRLREVRKVRVRVRMRLNAHVNARRN